MARTVKDTNLEKAAARTRLEARRKPYWRVLESGLHLGYRRTKEGGGSWVARRFIGDGKYKEHVFGVADDLQGADGVTILSFSDAQAKAREWWKAAERAELGFAPVSGPYTVGDAIEAYFAERERRGSKGLAKDRSSANARILPELGTVELAKLTTKRIRDWQSALATAPKLNGAHSMQGCRVSNPVDMTDANAVRARRATANRTFAVLRAALNHAFQENRVASDETWRKVKPFREVSAPLVHFLSDDECRRIVNACDGTFRNIVKGALLTGCRYGELTRMCAGDFNVEAGTITVQESKSGKPRHVVLTDEGRALFSELAAGRIGVDLIFVRDDGGAWGPSQQQAPMAAASNCAKIDPAPTFHILRHTYASALAMRGVPMGVIAAQLGHSDTRMTERHYAHLSPNYVAETVRAALPALGIVEGSNVASLTRRA
jgi:integrase